MRLSIIICTYNRCELLRICLESLVTQNPVNFDYEIIIINNNSTDDTAAVALEFKDRIRNYRIVNESTQGLSHAKNRGIDESLGEYVAYLDDDGWVDPWYVNAVGETIQMGVFDLFGGQLIDWYKDPKPDWFIKPSQFNKRRRDEKASDQIITLKSGYISGGIFVVKKDLINRLGRFPIHIGMNGLKVSYGEETLVQNKFRREGGEIGYNPKIALHHLVPEYKMTVSWTMKSFYKRGYCYWAMHEIKPTPLDAVKAFFLIPLSFILSLVRTVKNCFGKRIYMKQIVLRLFTLPFYFAGKCVSSISSGSM